MNFWELAYGWGWATIAQLRIMTITDTMPFGEITKEEFKRITGEDFDPVTPEPEVPEIPEPEEVQVEE
ncbi:XkdX family protein [Sporosarcina sp. FSL K6-5500]|uniref:XkdX family protein n=1 Tax=Sporosarcina sp. FSL K6-5500 TaxID=2921558 RepID=UPI0030FB02C2